MILLLLIFCIVLILFGVLIDFIAKKKGFRFASENDKVIKNSSATEMMKQVHLNQAIGIGDTPNA
jgi:hypothetical protein